jgi:hypothetical protein
VSDREIFVSSNSCGDHLAVVPSPDPVVLSLVRILLLLHSALSSQTAEDVRDEKLYQTRSA